MEIGYRSEHDEDDSADKYVLCISTALLMPSSAVIVTMELLKMAMEGQLVEIQKLLLKVLDWAFDACAVSVLLAPYHSLIDPIDAQAAHPRLTG